MKRQIDSLKFVRVNQLYKENSNFQKTVYLVFDYSLPIIGLAQGVKNIKLSSSIQPGKWQ